MDKKSVIGFILLGILFVAFLLVQSRASQNAQIAEMERLDSLQKVKDIRIADSTTQAQKLQAEFLKTAVKDSTLNVVDLTQAQIQKLQDSVKLLQQKVALGPFSGSLHQSNESYTLENNELKIELSNRGGRIINVELKQYKDFKGDKLDLIKGNLNKFGYTFYFDQDKIINTDSLYFTPIIAAGGQSITMRLDAGNGRFFDQIYTFNDTAYLVDYTIKLTGFNELIPQQNPLLILNWQNTMWEQEKNLEYERQYSKLYFSYTNKDIDYKSANGDIEFDSKVKWVSCQQQFFNATIIAKSGFDNSGKISVYADEEDTTGIVKNCIAELYIPYANQTTFEFPMQLYLAPNDFQSLKSLDLGLEEIVSMGTGMIGWINKWMIIPVFNWLGGFVLNYGLVILLLTLIIKLVLTPLTYRSYLSMAKMKVLQPEMAELKEKHKDDQARFGQEQLKLYRKAGVNPLGGCIPTLLGMPILIALFRLFPGSIELRQKSFLWAKDLSSYDDIIRWGFDIPFLGQHLSIFCVLMTISSIMYVQLNMAQATTLPKEMKFMQYLMPFFFLFFLNSSPAGLTYYYFVSNMVTFGQQWGIRKFFINEKAIHAKIEENKTKPVKKSKFSMRLEEAMKQQQSNKNTREIKQNNKKK